jgi:DNA mismatch endonuclease (patch repair protein)
MEFWVEKFDRNVARDARNVDDLKCAGWRVLTIWECETKDKDRAALAARLSAFLGPPTLRVSDA